MSKSTASHKALFKPSANMESELNDVVRLITSVLSLDINVVIKKRMLNHAIWEVAYATGNFKGRYRSQGVIDRVGIEIQRDHVHQKKDTVGRLLKGQTSVEQAVRDTIHCVVTREEHLRLSDYSKLNPEVDGWNRYNNIGIVVHDMLTGKVFECGF